MATDERGRRILLTPGETTVVNNSMPYLVEVKVETRGGTKLIARLPPNGECEVTAGSDLVAGSLVIFDVGPIGPRGLDKLDQ